MSARNLKAIQKLKRRAMDPRNKTGEAEGAVASAFLSAHGSRGPHGVAGRNTSNVTAVVSALPRGPSGALRHLPTLRVGRKDI